MNRGGGGFNCTTQQQRRAQVRGSLRLGESQVGAGAVPLYAASGGRGGGPVTRLNLFEQDIYRERLDMTEARVQVRVDGAAGVHGEVGWADTVAIESAGEKCSLIAGR